MKKTSDNIEYLKRCKKTSVKQRLQWMADALEFARAKKEVLMMNGVKVK